MTAPTSGVQSQHQAALDHGRFLIQRCGACQRFVHFPRELCPHCGALSLHFVEPAGTGTVHATTVVRRAAEQGGSYNVCLVDLDEGVRLMSRVDGPAPGDVQVGQRVRARVQLKDGHGLVVFSSEAAS
jgi:hypothetical protein